MAQKMVYCFTNISDIILWHILGCCFCAEHLVVTHFYQMLLPLKASEIICAKAALLWHQNVWLNGLQSAWLTW
jgi:hypothetical protein